MATYNFSFNSNLTSYLSNNDLYFRLNDSIFFPSMDEMDGILARLETPKEACAIALMWGWVQTTSEFWRPIKDKSSMTDILARVSSLYTYLKESFSPPAKIKEVDFSAGIDMLWEISQEEIGFLSDGSHLFHECGCSTDPQDSGCRYCL